MRITTTVAITLVLLAGAWASAAELALRPQCESRGPVVTLGDVVDVVTTDSGEAARLAAIELFPSPAPGRQRHVRQREIQDLLLLRGVNLARHRFSGSSQVAVCRAGAPTKTEPEKSLSMSTQRRVKRQVCEAIIDYLNQKVEATQPWSVELELDESQTRLLAQAGAAAAIDGGQNPWTGKQRFDVTVNLPEGSGTRFALDAQVALPPAVVVTTHAMPRGVVVRATDVMLDRGEAAIADGEGFHAIEEVVGRETTRAVPVGKILKRDSCARPVAGPPERDRDRVGRGRRHSRYDQRPRSGRRKPRRVDPGGVVAGSGDVFCPGLRAAGS